MRKWVIWSGGIWSDIQAQYLYMCMKRAFGNYTSYIIGSVRDGIPVSPEWTFPASTLLIHLLPRLRLIWVCIKKKPRDAYYTLLKKRKSMRHKGHRGNIAKGSGYAKWIQSRQPYLLRFSALSLSVSLSLSHSLSCAFSRSIPSTLSLSLSRSFLNKCGRTDGAINVEDFSRHLWVYVTAILSRSDHA